MTTIERRGARVVLLALALVVNMLLGRRQDWPA